MHSVSIDDIGNLHFFVTFLHLLHLFSLGEGSYLELVLSFHRLDFRDGQNSVYQAWQWAPLPTESSHQPKRCISMDLFLSL